MRKTALIILVVALMGFGYQKALTVSATEKEWDYHFRNLNTIQNIVDNSDLPHQQVKFINNSIDSLKQLAFPQLMKQIADTTKKK